MHDDPERRHLLRAGLLLLAAAALAGAIELLALQAPGSPLYLGVLPGPLGEVRVLALALGLVRLASDVLSARAAEPLPKALTRLLSSSAALAVLAQAYGAAQGMYGLQVKDLRADALPLFLLKYAALLAFTVGYGLLGARALRGPSATPPT